MLISKFLSRKKKGASLLEIVISIAIIAILIIPVANLILGSVKNNKLAEDKQQGKAILQEAVEKIRNLDEIKSGENIELQNGMNFKISSGDKDGSFVIQKEYGGGYEISGSIKEKKREGINKIGSSLIDGILYYKSGKMSLISGEGGKTIEESVKQLKEENFTDGNNAEVTLCDDGTIEVVMNGNTRIISGKNKSFLIASDSENKDKLKLSLENKSLGEFSVYTYTADAKSKIDNIELEGILGKVNITRGINSEQLKTNITYELNISIDKDERAVESINTFIVKEN